MERRGTVTGSVVKLLLPLVVFTALYYAVMGVLGGQPYFLLIASLACLNVIMAVSLNLINGYVGLFSIGHAGFLAIGAYIAAILTKYFGVPFVASLVVGGLGAGLVGVLVGLPTLRLRGDYLAIATLGFGEIIRVVIVNIDRINVSGKVLDIGGPRGLMGIPGFTNFGWSYLFAVITIVFVINFVHSSHGRACIAIREDEVAAEAMGVNTTYYKVAVFAIGAFFAGLAGGLYAHLYNFMHPDSAGFLKSVDYLVMTVVGGLGSTTGSVIAAVLLTGLSEGLRYASQELGRATEAGAIRMVVYSLLLVVIMLARPRGLLGGVELSVEGVLGAGRAVLRFPSRVLHRAGGETRGAP